MRFSTPKKRSRIENSLEAGSWSFFQLCKSRWSPSRFYKYQDMYINIYIYINCVCLCVVFFFPGEHTQHIYITLYIPSFWWPNGPTHGCCLHTQVIDKLCVFMPWRDVKFSIKIGEICAGHWNRMPNGDMWINMYNHVNVTYVYTYIYIYVTCKFKYMIYVLSVMVVKYVSIRIFLGLSIQNRKGLFWILFHQRSQVTFCCFNETSCLALLVSYSLMK